MMAVATCLFRHSPPIRYHRSMVTSTMQRRCVRHFLILTSSLINFRRQTPPKQCARREKIRSAQKSGTTVRSWPAFAAAKSRFEGVDCLPAQGRIVACAAGKQTYSSSVTCLQQSKLGGALRNSHALGPPERENRRIRALGNPFGCSRVIGPEHRVQ
jgi:hypothetical protein